MSDAYKEEVESVYTWTQAIEYAWPEIELSLSKSSRASYRNHYRRFEKMWGSMLVTEATVREMTLYFGKRAQEVRSSTVKHEHAALRRLLGILVRDSMIAEDVAGRVKIKSELFHNTDWLDSQDEEKLFQYMDPCWVSLCVFSLNTGLRRSEQFNLIRKDINLKERLVTVQFGKTKRTRQVPLNDLALNALDQWLSAHNDEHLFLPEMGREHVCQLATNTVTVAAKQAQIVAYWRMFRHTFASRLVKRGVSLYVVQRLLGHGNPNMTMRYAHVGAGPLREAVQVLDEALLSVEAPVSADSTLRRSAGVESLTVTAEPICQGAVIPSTAATRSRAVASPRPPLHLSPRAIGDLRTKILAQTRARQGVPV